MPVLNRGQRELLADKLVDGANLAVGAVFLGQFVTGAPFSIPVALFGIALIAGVIVLLDYLGRRQQRKARQNAGRCSPSPHVDDFWP